ncbi:uncharacterized protein CELE_R07B1.11 [Caenorhabditis elegans]|uniref:Secreted protein n=1 Tax=Caenorhabditis elegans TaxID=6239 RepID=Q7YWU6_CAEEL|nr:Secreted protein [Caenorhabditis elegans]CAE17931.1 Secreted protein [Caenorhabditis elegans]|eukprot:NP_001024836.1 Uncharacterized protein CELE_R07B1.11 [Caenorhabditis elegans]
MYYLFVGFLAPAILILILGLFACLKKTTSTRFDDKDYQSIYSTDENQVRIRMPAYDSRGVNSYQMIYENQHFVDYKHPPTYNEVIRHIANTKPPSRHLPPNQPRILERGVPHQKQQTTIY